MMVKRGEEQTGRPLQETEITGMKERSGWEIPRSMSVQLQRGQDRMGEGVGREPHRATIADNSSARVTETTASNGMPDAQRVMLAMPPAANKPLGHHDHFVKLGRLGSPQVPSPTSPRRDNLRHLTPTGRPAVLCSVDNMVSPTVHTGPFSANSTAQTKDGPRGKSDKIDGGLSGPRAAHKRKLRSVVLRKVAITSRTSHSPHLTTRRTVRHE